MVIRYAHYTIQQENPHRLTTEAAAPAVASFGFGIAIALDGLVLGVGRAFPVALLGVGLGSLIAFSVTKLRNRTPRASSVEGIASKSAIRQPPV